MKTADRITPLKSACNPERTTQLIRTKKGVQRVAAELALRIGRDKPTLRQERQTTLRRPLKAFPGLSASGRSCVPLRTFSNSIGRIGPLCPHSRGTRLRAYGTLAAIGPEWSPDSPSNTLPVMYGQAC